MTSTINGPHDEGGRIGQMCDSTRMHGAESVAKLGLRARSCRMLFPTHTEITAHSQDRRIQDRVVICRLPATTAPPTPFGRCGVLFSSF